MPVLNFQMACQEQEHWCWAAVAAAVKSFLSNATVKQCQVATSVLAGDLCTNPDAGNQEFGLGAALGPDLKEIVDGQISFDYVRDQIDRGLPVCVRIVWDADRDGIGENAHFVVVVGYDEDGQPGDAEHAQFVEVQDPLAGGSAKEQLASSQHLQFDNFRLRYGLHGTWLQTYLIANNVTKPVPPPASSRSGKTAGQKKPYATN